MNVLMLEDDPQVQRAYVRMFNQTGHNLVVVSCPADAFKKLEAGFQPHIVFSDWDMPGMTGGEFCRVARERGLTFPIVILSGIMRFAEGMTASLTKPIGRNDLLDAIERHARK